MGVALMVRVGDHPIAMNVLKRWFTDRGLIIKWRLATDRRLGRDVAHHCIQDPLDRRAMRYLPPQRHTGFS